MSGLNKKRRTDETRPSRLLAGLRSFARRFIGDKRANVLIMFGLTLPLLLAIVAGGVDFSLAQGAKVNLQDASDAASLAVSAEVVKNPNDSVATLKTLAAATLAANDPTGTNLTITDFHVCAPVQNDCTDGGATVPSDTVVLTAQATTTCIPIPLPTMVCSGSPPGQAVSASTKTVIGFGATLQINVVMDSSGSMIVGSTPADVTAIANWMSVTTTSTTPVYTNECTGSGRHQTCQEVQTGTTTTTNYPNWNSVRMDDQGPAFPSDNPPCSFTCHVESNGNVSAADMAQGLTNAHAANAVTRFDVMISAANQLITSIQSNLTNNANLAKNNYVFNVYSFDDSIHKYGTANMPCSATACSLVTNAISQVAVGEDTYLNAAMATFAGTGTNSIGTNGTGASTASPLKFMILVTDGLQSDRSANWTASGTQPPNPEPEWNYSTNKNFKTITGGFDGPISLANCTTLKNEGVVLAVLETPYVPLTGQSPAIQPYEQTVRYTIWPGGPNSTSVISTALQACATTGYYFQATNPSDIATGFLTLTNKFIQQTARISQ